MNRVVKGIITFLASVQYQEIKLMIVYKDESVYQSLITTLASRTHQHVFLNHWADHQLQPATLTRTLIARAGQTDGWSLSSLENVLPDCITDLCYRQRENSPKWRHVSNHIIQSGCQCGAGTHPRCSTRSARTWKCSGVK